MHPPILCCILHDLILHGFIFQIGMCIFSLPTFSIGEVQQKSYPGAGESKSNVSELCYNIQKVIPAFLIHASKTQQDNSLFV